jgi:hypothetical protein
MTVFLSLTERDASTKPNVQRSGGVSIGQAIEAAGAGQARGFSTGTRALETGPAAGFLEPPNVVTLSSTVGPVRGRYRRSGFWV